MPTGPKTGHQMKLYYNSATIASPTYVEVADVGDVNLADFARGLAELKRRSSDFTKNLASLIQSIALEFRLLYGLNETVFDALRAAFLNATTYQWMIMDGDITANGTEGWAIPFLIENFPWDQNLEDVSGQDVRLAIAYMVESATEVDPEWVTISV